MFNFTWDNIYCLSISVDFKYPYWLLILMVLRLLPQIFSFLFNQSNNDIVIVVTYFKLFPFQLYFNVVNVRNNNYSYYPRVYEDTEI